MDFDYHGTFARIKAKASILADRYQMLIKEKNDAVERVDTLEKELAKANAKIAQLSADLEYLRVVSTIAPNRDQVEQARAMIQNLVRDIDRCIADLTD